MCDKPDAKPFPFVVDTESDGAGSRDTIFERVDLCGECCATQLELFIAALPWPARAALVKKIRGKSFYLSHMGNRERTFGGVLRTE